MNADEIVKALRCYASDCGDDEACGQCTFAWMCEEMDGNAPKIIADLIERLNDFEHSQCAVLLARIAELEARLAASQHREQAAVEDMTAVLKRDSDDICAYCKNRIECKNEQCEKYSSGVGDVDGNYPDWKWTCMDFDYGTCSLLADTPCNGCFDDDCKGFEWRGQQAGKGDAPNE